MNILMFGWEFPPYASGGLGTACEGLVKGLSNKGQHITFIAPRTPNTNKDNIKLVSANDEIKNIGLDKINIKNVNFRSIPGLISPYMTDDEYLQKKSEYLQIRHEELLQARSRKPNLYGKDLFHEVYLFSERSKLIASKEDFDVIHAHDWLTFQAGIKAKEISKKPLVVHVHATEFDRTGGNGLNEYVYKLEKEGMEKADRIITVSNYTKKMVIDHYGISPAKIDVVHNAVDFKGGIQTDKKINDEKTVLFLGRVTLQKGPDYFIYAARRLLDVYPNVRFIIAGSGDMEPFMIEKAAELGIADKVMFSGFLTGDKVDRAYQMADLYVMPSVSEPFGITPLEALRNNVPVIISKQSGVSEVLRNAIKVDYWDIDDLASKMISVLHYPELWNELKDNGSREVRSFSWDAPAEKCVNVYNKTIKGIK